MGGARGVEGIVVPRSHGGGPLAISLCVRAAAETGYFVAARQWLQRQVQPEVALVSRPSNP